jgi:hypothetical protein
LNAARPDCVVEVGNVVDGCERERRKVIHFKLTTSRNYKGVQDQLLGLIKKHLPAAAWTESEQYRKGALNFSLFIEQKSDVLMSHGAADKNYHFRKGKNGRGAARLNHTLGRKHLLVPGPWLKRRITSSKVLAFSAAQVHVVGWPRLDLLFEELDAHEKSLSQVAGQCRKRILWAPTHDYYRQGTDDVSLSSYPEFEDYLPKLSERFDVGVSIHPRNRSDKTPTQSSLVEADVVISDFGTMVYEAIALGKQVIFPSWIIGDRIRQHLKHSAEHRIYSEKLGLHAESFEHLLEMIDAGTKLDARSREFFDDFLPPATYRRSGQLIADFLLKTAPPVSIFRKTLYPLSRSESPPMGHLLNVYRLLRRNLRKLKN